MAAKLLLKPSIDFDYHLIRHSLGCLYQTIRCGHVMRGKPPGVARTLEQRMQELNAVDPEIVKQIDIGFPKLKPSRTQQLKERLTHVKTMRSNLNLEKQSREKTLEVNLDEVKNEWLHSSGQFHIRDIAQHYGIYQHLFGAAYFIPRVPLDIKYQVSEDLAAPVYYGNTIKPAEAKEQPNVKFDSNANIIGNESKKQFYWTLILTNPDGHLKDNTKEYVHWLITNIKDGNNITTGELIAPYIQPFPYKGTGYHRHIFILYRHESKLDLSSYIVKNKNDLEARTFSTLDFYRKHQDDITPAGLAFFQSDWEQSLTDFYHNVLCIKEPIYEYDFPKQYIKPQSFFPLREPFNLYMDKYRDQKQVGKEFLERKLAKTHPFKGPTPPLRFPNAHPIKSVPSWLKTEMKKERLGWGRINDF